MKHKLIACFLWISSLVTVAGVHPIPHYDFDPMPPCACKPFFALKDKQITQTNLARWAEYAILNLYNYGFGNYEASFKQASHFFTPDGWQDIQEALEESGNVDEVIRKKLLVSAEIMEPAFLVRQPSTNEWLYQMKVAVSYDSASERINQVLKLNLLLRKYKPLQTVGSVGVHQISTEVIN